MKMLTFARRNAQEILRDKLNLLFGIGFPVVILLLLSAIQANIPQEAKQQMDLFRIEKLAPGITVFGLSFMTLFSATLIAKDRGTSLLQRLYTAPLTASDFILGYTLREGATSETVLRSRVDRAIAFWREQKEKHGKEALISAADSKIPVWVIPTNEELVIARDTCRLLGLH